MFSLREHLPQGALPLAKCHRPVYLHAWVFFYAQNSLPKEALGANKRENCWRIYQAFPIRGEGGRRSLTDEGYERSANNRMSSKTWRKSTLSFYGTVFNAEDGVEAETFEAKIEACAGDEGLDFFFCHNFHHLLLAGVVELAHHIVQKE